MANINWIDAPGYSKSYRRGHEYAVREQRHRCWLVLRDRVPMIYADSREVAKSCAEDFASVDAEAHVSRETIDNLKPVVGGEVKYRGINWIDETHQTLNIPALAEDILDMAEKNRGLVKSQLEALIAKHVS